MNVVKRNGTKEEVDFDKIHKVLFWACEGINGVSVSDIALNAQLQVFDGITTKEIHQVIIQSAADLISEQNPNYQFVAANLVNYYIRKNIFGVGTNLPSLYDLIVQNVDAGVYDKKLLEDYSREEINKMDKSIRHDRDYNFTYAGIQQMIDKYLLKDRSNEQLFETPQYMYMCIALTLFSDAGTGTERLKRVRSFYNDISLHKISLPTPMMCGVRTPNRQYSSCTLIDVGDSLDSLFNSNTAVGYYTAKRAGIGLNFGRIRALGDRIRNGEVVHTGVIPYLKMFESTVKSCTQNGVRGGSATVYFPFWHKEIREILVLKNNKGTDDNRVRKLDYGIQFCRLFYRRFVKNEDISLFSPNDTQDMMEAFGIDNDRFEELYLKYENDETVTRKTMKARDLFNQFCQERIGTGRMYVMNIDNANDHSSFTDKINMSNLCTEITLPTTPINHIDDADEQEGEIALCVLSAVNVGKVNDLNDLEGVCENIVRSLDFVVDHQDYPVAAAKKMLKRRSLGIGVTNLAYYLAKHGVKYEDPEALNVVDELFEHIQYYCIKASVKLAKELGPCEWFHRTKYAKGILPIDTYAKAVDKLTDRKLSLDWEGLRAEILEHGMRNSTLTAIMPCESSSVVTNSTNGIEPVRALVTSKKSKQGILKMVVPEIGRLKNKYTMAFDMESNTAMTNIQAVIQKYIDQGISANHYYNINKNKTGSISLSEVAKDLLYFYKTGGKMLYYANTYDAKTDDFEQNLGIAEEACAGGACAI